ncbi:MAG: DNA-binding protein WhiA [Clostridia bacterium]|nr:DNA-binding protein WhiA [Clostridia bacterium]
MSFSKNVKKELAQFEPENQCCLCAQTYGLLLFGRSFSTSSIKLLSESKDAAKTYSEFSMDFTGIEPSFLTTKSGKFSVTFNSKNDRWLVLNSFGHSEKEVTLRINRANFEDDCCYGSFIRGAFLSCGTITDPNKNYHLEFVVQKEKLCKDLKTLMQDVELNPKVLKRGNNFVLYFKDSEEIEDVLTIMGATESSLNLMGIKMMKSVRNKINRQINFETANISRTINASMVQINAINKIKERKAFNSLPLQLQKIAEIRLNNPDMSLGDMQKELDEDISRSGVNHRLNKLIEIADKLK